ncbi:MULTISPECIES: hypothetical protein [unclassified Corallococcus]|uniref:hypothetical protein n=1 Tax=unclassified Corallococcus TaxID=2685029 RepID=UPI001A8CDE47|nr:MULTISPECIES: hypothetical protein [unclassified Corallococcus]MBN9688497.1 hypothetical protein [Corallococcus sp. NCSPR001]WAS87701.1 hypothetical protein O0N60_12160 [Corallococcus sp. NCRR]
MRAAIVAGLWAVGLLMGCGGPAAEEGADLQQTEQALDPVEACLEACSVNLSRCLQNATTQAQIDRCELIGASCPRKCSTGE